MRLLVPGVIGLVSAGAQAQFLADFDELPEGFQPTTFVSDGITFSNGTWFPGSVNLTFGIDDGSGDMPALGFGNTFTSPNVMTVGGYVTSPQSAFFRVHSWQARVPGQTFHQGQVDVYYINNFLGAVASLHAFSGETIVATDSFTITNPNKFEALHERLELHSAVPFDRLMFRVMGGPPGGNENGLLAIFDNVGLDVPAPAGALILLAGLPLLRRRRR